MLINLNNGSGGDVEEKILQFAKQNGKSFDDARRMAPSQGIASSKETAPYDYRVRKVRELELHRARIAACDDGMVGYEERDHLRKMMNCKEGDNLDSKRSNFKFINKMDIAIAAQSALGRLLKFEESCMSSKDKLRFHLQAAVVERRILLDLGRIGDPTAYVPLVIQFIEKVFRPDFGRNVSDLSIDEFGNKVGYVSINKDLINEYDTTVRSRLDRSGTYDDVEVGRFSLAGACMAYNEGVEGGNCKACEEKDDSAHGRASHWCLRCGPRGRHPVVCCARLRCCFRPTRYNRAITDPSTKRPDCSGKRFGNGAGRGGRRGDRGRGTRRGDRGRYRHMGDRTGDSGRQGDPKTEK